MDERRRWSMEYFVEQNKVWFIDFQTNDLYEQDLESGQLVWMNCFPVEGSQFKSHPLCVKWQDTIFAIPDFGENIWLYYMNTGKFSKISIGGRKTRRYGSRNPIVLGDEIWVPVCGQLDIHEPRRILHINAKTHRYEWSDSITESGLCLETVYKDGYIYLASSEDGVLYVFDITGNRYESYYIKELDRGIETVCGTGKEIWLSDCTGKIACWDIALRKITRTTALPFSFLITCGQKVGIPFLQSRYANGRVCYIPAHTNPLHLQEAFLFDPVSLSCQAMPFISSEDVDDNYILAEFVTDDGKIGIWTKKNNSILLLDTRNGRITEKEQTISKKDRTLLWLRSHPLSTETPEWDITSFLDMIKDDRLPFAKEERLKKDAGTKIHGAICP